AKLSLAGNAPTRSLKPLVRPGHAWLPFLLLVAFVTTNPALRAVETSAVGLAYTCGGPARSSQRSASQSASSKADATSAQNTRAGCGGHSATVGRRVAASYRPSRRRATMLSAITPLLSPAPLASACT